MLTADYKDDAFQMSLDQIQELIQAHNANMNLKNSALRMKSYFSSGNTNMTTTPQDDVDLLGKWYLERAKFVPMRLTLEERKRLRLVDAFLKGSTYVDRVDSVYQANAAKHDNKARLKRMNEKIKCITTTFIGFVGALNFEAGKELSTTRDFARYAEEFRSSFEIARRYKIMNPDKLRDSYGKMIMLLQDASSPEAKEALGFDVVAPIKTVYSVLEQVDRLEVLKNEWTSTATMDVINDLAKSKQEIREQVKLKETGLETLGRRYATAGLSPDNVKQCLYSIGDNASYLNSNCKPVDEVITLLKKYFDPQIVGNNPSMDRSLAIYGGQDGARLTHTHERQFNYVLQTMTLWREILHEIFRLWTLAETDLLDSAVPYKWRDTGQGFHRLQDSPRISKAMHGILYAVQQMLGTNWVGSSVIHINDSNVPNALVFIDKWNQVPRILNPIVQTLRHLDNVVARDEGMSGLVTNALGGVEEAKIRLLHDFFRHGFDGSGGDNFFEAGSCVDARLTSAWNWCQELPKKDFFFLFRLASFLGFDGSF